MPKNQLVSKAPTAVFATTSNIFYTMCCYVLWDVLKFQPHLSFLVSFTFSDRRNLWHPLSIRIEIPRNFRGV